MNIDTSVEVGGISLKNPVLVASGTFAYGQEFSRFMDLSQIGGVVTKSKSLEPRRGNPPGRVFETASGMLNSIGLQNVGIEGFISDKMPFLRAADTAVIVNIVGKSTDEFVELARRLDDCPGIDGVEVNMSCPNVKEGGMSFSCDPNLAYELISGVKRATDIPVIGKLTPNVTDVGVIAKAVEDAGADAVSLINTLVGMAVDLKTKKPELSTVTGGLSGPAVKPVALAMVWKVAETRKIPIIGIGGITSAEDVLEFMITGASAVQVGSANFRQPNISAIIAEGIVEYCQENKIERISDIVGTLEVDVEGSLSPSELLEEVQR